MEYNSHTDIKNTPKKNNEIRILWIDFAWATQTGKEKNDNTVIGLLSLFLQEDNKFMINFHYLESYEGNKTKYVQQRIREIYWDGECDYIVPDIRSAGEVIVRDGLSSYWEHPERSNENCLRSLLLLRKILFCLHSRN